MRTSRTAARYLAFLVGFGAALAAGAMAARPDPSFGTRGVVTTRTAPVGETTSALALVADSRGRLIEAGGANEAAVVVRYLPGGRLDPSFSGDGKAYIRGWASPDRPHLVQAQAVAVQRSGKIVVVGHLRFGGLNPACFVIARLLPDGRPDSTFGQGGRVRDCHTGSDAFAVGFQRRGRLIVAGTGKRRAGRRLGVVARYTRNGQLDRSFGGGDGRVRVAFRKRARTQITDLHVLRSGAIYVSGHAGFDFLLARLRPDGSFERRFGHGSGRVATDVDGACRLCALAWALARDRNGRIVLVGRVEPENGTSYVVLARYRANGRLDTSFGRRGIVRTKSGPYLTAYHVAIQANGRIVIAGQTGFPPDLIKIAVIRYRSSGARDRSFFGNGILTRRVGPRSGARDVLIDRRQRIVISGGADRGATRHFLIARYLP